LNPHFELSRFLLLASVCTICIFLLLNHKSTSIIIINSKTVNVNHKRKHRHWHKIEHPKELSDSLRGIESKEERNLAPNERGFLKISESSKRVRKKETGIADSASSEFTEADGLQIWKERRLEGADGGCNADLSSVSSAKLITLSYIFLFFESYPIITTVFKLNCLNNIYKALSTDNKYPKHSYLSTKMYKKKLFKS